MEKYKNYSKEQLYMEFNSGNKELLNYARNIFNKIDNIAIEEDSLDHPSIIISIPGNLGFQMYNDHILSPLGFFKRDNKFCVEITLLDCNDFPLECLLRSFIDNKIINYKNI